MSNSASFTSGISGRYATALFELAKSEGQIDAIGADLEALEAALADSADLRRLISSPVYSREEQGKGIKAVADKMGLSALVANTLGLMASKRRLFVLPQLIKSVKGLIADDKGQVTAEVTAARELSQAQADDLAKTLANTVGKDKSIVINTTIDESLIGGLIVKVGSRMIDTSIRSKLANLQNAMKEVG